MLRHQMCSKQRSDVTNNGCKQRKQMQMRNKQTKQTKDSVSTTYQSSAAPVLRGALLDSAAQRRDTQVDGGQVTDSFGRNVTLFGSSTGWKSDAMFVFL